MKVKLLAAAAIMAIGVSAQAGGTATLGSYAVITLPVAAGYNFYGISVGVSDGAKWSDVITFADGDTTSLIINGVSGKTAAESAAQGAYAWYQPAANYQGGKVYQFGKDISAESQSLTVIPGAPAYFVSKKDLTLANFEALQTYSGKVNGSKASRLSVWNPTTQTYDQYFYRNVTDPAKAGWYLGSVKQEASLTIPAGTPIYVQVGTNNAPETGVTLSL